MDMRNRLLVAILLAHSFVALNPSDAGAGKNIPVAVTDFDVDEGVPLIEGVHAREYLETELAISRQFDVMERQKMEIVLAEHKFNLSDCVDESCVVELGRMLAVRKIIAGKMSRRAGKEAALVITVRLIDVELAKIDAVETVHISTIEKLEDGMKQIKDETGAPVSLD